jgi:predicted secreted protein
VRLTSALAIYALFWALSLFLVLPFGVRSHHETGDPLLPGQSDGAPANYSPRRVLVWTTIVAAVLFGAFYANYVNGWIGADTLNLFGRPPEAAPQAS